MKVQLIAHCTDYRHPGYLQLKRSLDHFGWDYHFNNDPYVAYGSKMISAYLYARDKAQHQGYTHLFIVDAYDIFVLGTMQQALDKIPGKNGVMIFNAEKAAWPYADWAKEYPVVDSYWKYLNGGAAFVDIHRFITFFEENPIKHTDNDQVNLARAYLDKRDQYGMYLDTDCALFQSIAFEGENDFEIIKDYSNTQPPIFRNRWTGTYPLIIHGNGKTDMSKIYKLI